MKLSGITGYLRKVVTSYEEAVKMKVAAKVLGLSAMVYAGGTWKVRWLGKEVQWDLLKSEVTVIEEVRGEEKVPILCSAESPHTEFIEPCDEGDGSRKGFMFVEIEVSTEE